MDSNIEYIDVQGPESGGMDINDEFPVWTVALMDKNDDPIDWWEFRSMRAAKTYGESLAEEYKVELNDEAMPS